MTGCSLRLAPVKSPICSQVQLIPNCFEKEGRFPFNNTATVNTSFRLACFRCRGLLEWSHAVIKCFSLVHLIFSTIFAKVLHKVCNIKLYFIGFESVKTLNAWATFWWMMYTSTPVETVSKSVWFYWPNSRESVQYEKFTANANYDMQIKIQGRIHLGKLRITVERQVNLKWETSSKCSSAKFVHDFQTMDLHCFC